MCFKVKTVFMMNNSVQLCPLTVLHHQANFSVVKVPCLREAPKQTALQSNLTPHYLYVTNTTPGRLREITLTFQYLPFHISVILVSKGIRLFHSSFPFLFFFPHFCFFFLWFIPIYMLVVELRRPSLPNHRKNEVEFFHQHSWSVINLQWFTFIINTEQLCYQKPNTTMAICSIIPPLMKYSYI